MGEAGEIIFGVAVTCEGHDCGELRCAIVDRTTLGVTHLVVAPTHHGDRGRVVPIEMVEAASADGVELSCTRAQYDALQDAQTSELVPGPTAEELEQEQLTTMVSFHIYGRRPSSMMGVPGRRRRDAAPPRVTHDNVPPGEGEVALKQPVHASDGDIGHVHGLLVESAGHRVTHVLLGEGHLWGQKEVAIPVAAVKDVFEDGVLLSLTKDAVGSLPPVARTKR